MQFNNGIIAPLIIQPLRYFFSTYSANTNLIWNSDEKIRTVDIGESFDFNKIALQEKPRVIVSRGSYGISKIGLSDNLSEATSFSITGGNKDNINMVFYQGSAIITIEARNKGTCELLADLVSHFIIWTRPVLCDSQGWKEFGLPMSVSDVGMTQDEDPGIPKFQINIGIPWIKEEHWNFKTDGIELKNIITKVVPTF